jgi:hypothetical protein
MQINRVTTLLQSIAETRNWTMQYVPSAKSLVGYDLFLKIGNDYFAGAELTPQSVYQTVPHSREEIDTAIAEMERAGLIERVHAEGGDWSRIVPTQRFAAILAAYQRKFESLFILRKGLRDQQLLVACDEPELAHFAESLYDHFYDLGWLYLHNFGSACFLMASLVRRVASAYGFQARIASGYVEIAAPNVRYYLGAKGYAHPGQIEGHAMCVINDKLILDFGLGNVRKGYRRDFYWALACEFQPRDHMLGSMMLPSGESVVWKNDWQSPESEAELKMYEPAVEELFKHYLSYFG